MSERRSHEKAVAACYSTWGSTYYDDYYGENAPYTPVHRDLLRQLLQKSGAKSLLDAGCGPASLLRDIADLDLELYGFDLTPEMVEEAKRIFDSRALGPERIWLGSVLDPHAYRHPEGEGPDQYEAVVCIGVLPHLPAEADVTVLAHLREAVAPGGLVVVEARNQLFSLFTVNRYSYEFIVNDLIRSSDLRDRLGGQGDVLDNELERLKKSFRMDLPPIRKGKKDEPGYDEIISRTHNPLVLAKQMTEAGYTDVSTHFYHFHCLPPLCGQAFPEEFERESLAMENPDDWRGLFMASAFMLSGRRA